MSSGWPDATLALIRSASGKSAGLDSAWAESGKRQSAAARIRCRVLICRPPEAWFVVVSSGPAHRPSVDADRYDDHETDHQFLHEGRHPDQHEAVAHHADDEDAENGAEDGALAARQGGAADDRGRDDVELEPEAGAAGLAARQE